MKISKICSYCGAWSLLGTKFTMNRLVLKYFNFENLCSCCFVKYKKEYDEYIKKKKEELKKEYDNVTYRTVLDLPEKKVCARCELLLDISKFFIVKYKDRNKEDYIIPRSICNKCQSIATQESYNKHDREEWLNKNRAYHREYYKNKTSKKK